MGILISKLMEQFNSHGRVLILGLDCAGKTSVLYQIQKNTKVNINTTRDFNVATVTPEKGLTLELWDVSGNDKMRSKWIHFYHDAAVDVLVYVVDSADEERLADAKEALFPIIDDNEMKGVPLLVLANKKDLPSALCTCEIGMRLGLNKITDRPRYIQAICGTSGEGISDAVDELVSMVKQVKKKERTSKSC